MNNTKKIALCGILAALSLVFLLATGLIPIGTFALPALSGLITVLAVLESGKGYAWSVYFITAILGAVLAPDKEAVLYYIAFFGYYPILKNIIEAHINNKIYQYVFKFLIFNLAVIACFFVSISLLSIPKESFNIMGHYLPWAFLVLGNVVFIMYDIAMSSLIVTYVLRWRKKLFRK